MSSDYYESKESDKKPDIIFEKSKNFKILFFTRNTTVIQKKTETVNNAWFSVNRVLLYYTTRLILFS